MVNPCTASTSSKPKTQKKYKHQRKKDIIAVNSSGDSSDPESKEVATVPITQQLSVKEIQVLKTIPSTWTVFDGTWLLDLADFDENCQYDEKGKFLSMAALIKSEVHSCLFIFLA